MKDERDMRQVDPVSPVAAYVGGKRRLAAELCRRIAATPHRTYAEAFVGMGGVFFRRTSAPPAEVINDRNGEVANLFRILQRHLPQFMDTLRFQLAGRREYERLTACDPSTLTDLERAGRFLYLQRLSFGGKVAGASFGVDPRSRSGFDLARVGPLLEAAHERLSGVTIENLDWAAFVDRYDRPGTLFYLDPPYWGSEAVYGGSLFDRGQFVAMADRLARIEGRFILSINDRPETRAVFARFEMAEARLNYTVGGGAPRPARELIITGGGAR